MRRYTVSIDMIRSGNIEVLAESEEQAIAIVNDMEKEALVGALDGPLDLLPDNTLVVDIQE